MSFIKSVIKTTLVVALSLFLATVLFVMVVVGVLFAIGKERTVSVPESAILVIDMNMEIPDAPLDEGSFAPLLDNTSLRSRVPLLSLLGTIEKAAYDPRIKGILLLGAGPDLPETGLSSVVEIRDAIAAFRESGKPVFAYVEDTGMRDLALASAASEIWIHPLCSVGMEGFSVERLYFGAAFKKYGINVQTASAGKYKSAPDSFALDAMRPEDREQLQDFIDVAWLSLEQMISQSRKITQSKINDLSQNKGVVGAGEALDAKLVDRIAYRDELDAELSKIVGKDKNGETFSQIDFISYQNDETSHEITSELTPKKPIVAVEYIEGDIVNGTGAWDEAGADRIAADLRSLRADKDVKAVVLRVNSPGGDAIAAEKIRREVELLCVKVPVVVSMGRMAASGGYWVSAPAKKIFAEPSTLTGSIGVFSLFVDVEKLGQNLGVTADSVGTSPFSNMYSLFKSKDDRQMALAHGMVDGIYERFLGVVATGRKMDVDAVAKIAQGRVWSGASALSNGLVDELGGLEAAISEAANLANLGDNYHYEEISVPLNFDDIMNEFIGAHVTTARVPYSSLEKTLVRIQSQIERAHVFARLPFFMQGRW
jgi:protease IV